MKRSNRNNTQAFYDLVCPFLHRRQACGCARAHTQTIEFDFLYLFVDIKGLMSCSGCARLLPKKVTLFKARKDALDDMENWSPDLRIKVGQVAMAYVESVNRAYASR